MTDKQYKLSYLPLFWDDLNSALHYITYKLKNPSAAERLLNKTEAAILEYSKNPTMAPVYQTKKERKHPYYWFSVGNYMVFYVVIDNTMEVRRFIYGSRDLTKIIV